ncbi:PH domain-containing protein [Streptomyces longwoodensis]|uniref:PH domain-containing protein n=1 Tax=Streptomyces lasalocidi TaxID=324833 RepID=A0A4U5WK39_STRLS|nr:PH domain-containing protein [Streptomyces lasalocidi]TKT02448.1 PH domain-containing protein [Streptomyces lasalocidi]
MTTPDHESPEPQSPVPAVPAVKDRIYRSPAGMAGGVLLLALMGWLGIDALVVGEGRVPWLALASLLLGVPLVVAFTLRPAVFADPERLRVRNPFRVVVLPWGQVVSLRSGFSNEAVTADGDKYQLWAVPVSLRARKRASRKEARVRAEAAAGREGRATRGGRGAVLPEVPEGPLRAETDKVMDELRHLHADHEKTAGPAPAGPDGVTVRWAWEILGPALAGAVLLVILIAVG